MAPKILFFDIETSPNLAYVWGKYEQNAIAFKKEWGLLSFAYKWHGEKEVYCESAQKMSEKALVKRLWKLLDSADIVVAHNGNDFDQKKSRAKFIEFGLGPTSPYRVVDTKLEARRYFKFNSNSLDDLGNILGVGRKVKTGGFDLWLGCMAGDKASWEQMIRYNKQDVQLLERVYEKLLPWMSTHPNLNQYISGDKNSCPKCSHPKLKSYGIITTNTQIYRKYRCLKCLGFSRERIGEKVTKPSRMGA